jgi:hypothetical protein
LNRHPQERSRNSPTPAAGPNPMPGQCNGPVVCGNDDAQSWHGKKIRWFVRRPSRSVRRLGLGEISGISMVLHILMNHEASLPDMVLRALEHLHRGAPPNKKPKARRCSGGPSTCHNQPKRRDRRSPCLDLQKP